MKINQNIAIQVPEIMLPNKNVDLTKWAVIACDQFTSQPDYWLQVAEIIGDSPSTYHMILPEIFLDEPDIAKRIENTHSSMSSYVNQGVLKSFTGLVYVERTFNGKTHCGLMVALDLESYDFSKGSQTLVRATEGTILERIPPRIRIRKDAPLESPHILVLYDDPRDNVLAPVKENLSHLKTLYDFDLMLGSGHLTGKLIDDPTLIEQIGFALADLADPQAFTENYHLPGSYQPLLFAMGDGNHSLATAKTIWEELKPLVGMDHPARYALVEIENLHDPALEFEPIHRLVFNVTTDISEDLIAWFGERIKIDSVADLNEWMQEIDTKASLHHHFGLLTESGPKHIEILQPSCNLPVGSLQTFLDTYLKRHPESRIDYVHGRDIITQLAVRPGHAGFYLPAMHKNDLFKTVILDGALPRKTFSMGEAKEKRFYMECRKIR